MSAPGFTPISLYFSTTAAATPSAGNLANGELAINITDGRLFYKDNGGTVRVLAGTGGSGVVAGSNTQVQFNNNGVFGASANMTFNGTRLTVADLADSGLTAGRVVYAGSGGALVDSANLTFDGNILSTTSAAIGGTLGMTVGGALNGTTINSTGVLLGGTQTLTINGGTANGVAYLNGSKVLTTGSALTFDGTTLLNTNGPINQVQPPSSGTLLHLAGSDASGSGRRVSLDSYSVNGFVVMGRQSNGSSAAPLPTLAGNILLFVNAKGSAEYSGTTIFSQSLYQGSMRIRAAENFTPTAQGTNIEWEVTPLGAVVPVVGMKLSTTQLQVNAAVSATEFINTADTGYAKFLPSTAYSKRIVIFGSSVAFGVGATNNQGWAYMLGQTLMAQGWTFNNLSINGNNTIDLIARFYTDVVPLQPDVVIIGLSLANEGILGSGKQAVFNQYMNNMYRLIDMCRQQGFKVIVTGTYPNNSYTSVEYNYCKQADLFLQTSQIPYINFMGAVDNGSGNWRTGMFADGGHPNDVGHTSMYRTIPLTLFDRFPYALQSYDVGYPTRGAVVMTGDTTTVSPIQYTVGTEPFGSWTIMMNAKMRSGSAQGIALFSIYNGNAVPLRLRAPSGTWDLASAGNLIVSTVQPSDLLDHQIAVTYNYYTNSVSLYIDGVAIGTADAGIYGENPTEFTILGRADNAAVNANGFEISKIAIYKMALNIDQIKSCYLGFYPKASSQVFAPCADVQTAAQTSLLNLAPTNATLLINTAALTQV